MIFLIAIQNLYNYIMSCSKITKDELKQQTVAATTHGFIKLAKDLEINEKNKVKQLEKEAAIQSLLDVCIDEFSIRQFLSEYPLMSENKKITAMFQILTDNTIAVKQMNEYKDQNKKLKSEVDRAIEDKEYHEEEENKYFAELEKSEKKYKDRETYWTNRTNNIRNKCIAYKNKLYFSYFGILVTNGLSIALTYSYFEYVNNLQ